ncbi:MAG: serine/threonine-protein kinase [Planctomycetota bacterium]
MPTDDNKTEVMRPEETVVESDATLTPDQASAADGAERLSKAKTEPHTSPSEDLQTDVQLASQSMMGSDVELDSDGEPRIEETLDAPSYPTPLEGRPDASTPREFCLEAGDQIDDFEVIEVLGRGAFGVVYLARQMSLDRRVALKITENRGSEGRTMARLEHDYVVQVFSESVDATGKLRLLCMQLVPGASLEGVIRALNLVSLRAGGWTGADYLAAIDERTRVRETFDPSALRDREMLAEADCLQTTAWVGARMAEAINFAHANSVLHRDIKPANVLINQYGRPLLADFNISFAATPNTGGENDSDSTFGGTLAFMAPEHLDAFSPHSDATPADVDERSDIYSLGIVVYELLTGRSPFEKIRRTGSRTRYVGTLAEHRRNAPAPIEAGPPTARKVLQRTIAKSLSPEKSDRYQTGEQFAAALDGCRQLASVEKAAPVAGAFARSVVRRPLLWAMLLIFLPQVVGSVVNITYNNNQIVELLTPEQKSLFPKLVTWYNAIVYPAALATLVYFFRPVFKMWRALQGSQRLDAEQVDEVRRATLRLPLWVLTAAAVGWLPGGVLFPAMLAWLSPPIDMHVFVHFVTSFSFSGLIAVAYSFCGMQYIAMRVLYPRLWTDATDFQAKARRELSGTAWRMWFMLGAAYVVPFVSNILFALLVRDESAIPLTFLVLSVATLGLFGTAIVFIATRAMTKTQVALTGQS